MSLFGILNSYDDIWKALIMPPRLDYSSYELGPPQFKIQSYHIQRNDFRLNNKRGMAIECSYYEHLNPCFTPMPCVVYLHANGCNKLEALQFMEAILANQMNYFCFDFTGCGNSEGQYCSIGLHEQDDLEAVINYLYSLGTVGKIGLWGRSMGAVTALLYCAQNIGINCLVADSSFSNIKSLVKEFAKSKASIPGFLGSAAYSLLRNTIKKKADFDLSELKPIKIVSKINIPILFGHAIDDALVSCDHTKELYQNYGGLKQLMIFEGDHNSTRPNNFVLAVLDFFMKHLLPPEKQYQNPLMTQRFMQSENNKVLSMNTNIENLPNNQDNNMQGKQKSNSHLRQISSIDGPINLKRNYSSLEGNNKNDDKSKLLLIQYDSSPSKMEGIITENIPNRPFSTHRGFRSNALHAETLSNKQSNLKALLKKTLVQDDERMKENKPYIFKDPNKLVQTSSGKGTLNKGLNNANSKTEVSTLNNSSVYYSTSSYNKPEILKNTKHPNKVYFSSSLYQAKQGDQNSTKSSLCEHAIIQDPQNYNSKANKENQKKSLNIQPMEKSMNHSCNDISVTQKKIKQISFIPPSSSSSYNISSIKNNINVSLSTSSSISPLSPYTNAPQTIHQPQYTAIATKSYFQSNQCGDNNHLNPAEFIHTPPLGREISSPEPSPGLKETNFIEVKNGKTLLGNLIIDKLAIENKSMCVSAPNSVHIKQFSFFNDEISQLNFKNTNQHLSYSIGTKA